MARLASLAVCALVACGDNARPVGATDAAPRDAAIDAIDAPPGVPDLVLVAAAMDGTILITNDSFDLDDCVVVEGCVGSNGTRRLLRFDTVTANMGTGDLVLGTPPADGMDGGLFVWSPCHQHHHVTGYAEYALLDGNGVVIGGHKQAFCLQDVQQVRPGSPSRGYNCDHQGMSAGWADVYSRILPCQWIDITDLTPGTYTLRVRVNVSGALVESDLTNNEWTRAVTF
jgi:hypothetical protein